MSQKIVISECFGGFGLSHKAYLRLKELGNACALSEADVGEFYEDGSGPRESWGKDTDSFCDRIARDDSMLVQVVEELGKDANAWAANLCIVEIPDGVVWVIDEYDGSETIDEVHRSWR
jgi:hypothetical protein